MYCHFRTMPSLIPLHFAAARLMPKQLNRKPVNLPECRIIIRRAGWGKYGAHLKKATREIERSSSGVREDAKIDLRTAGVTGIFLWESAGTGERPRGALREDTCTEEDDDIGCSSAVTIQTQPTTDVSALHFFPPRIPISLKVYVLQPNLLTQTSRHFSNFIRRKSTLRGYVDLDPGPTVAGLINDVLTLLSIICGLYLGRSLIRLDIHSWIAL
jgi:hypothetical protein